MNATSILSRIVSWILAVIIYMATFYYAYNFFYAYSYLGHLQIVIGAILIMLAGMGCVWIVFHLRTKIFHTKKVVVEKREEKIQETREEKKETKSPRMIQNEKDKKIKLNYQKLLVEYRKNLSPSDYKKFQEETKYDVLIYDALMVSRDKDGTVLRNIQIEKSAVYMEALKKILD